MHRRSTAGWLLATTSVLMVSLSCQPKRAEAQLTGTLNRFRPSETPEDDFHLSRPTDLGHLRWGVQLHVDYGEDPLIVNAAGGATRLAVVDSQLTGSIGISLGLADRVVLSAGMPVALVLDGEDATTLTPFGIGAAQGAGLGDVYLSARVRLVGEEDDAASLALQATATLPTSNVPNDSVYRGDTSLSAQPELLAEFRPGAGARIVVNVGARFRESSEGPAGIKLGQELTYGLGFAIPVWTPAPNSHLDVHLQGYGTSTIGRFDRKSGTAIEAILGAKFFHDSGMVFGVAGGPGITSGIGTSQFRIIGMLGWATPPAITPQDRDGDGVADDADACPDDPGPSDAGSHNGCPPDPTQDVNEVELLEEREPATQLQPIHPDDVPPAPMATNAAEMEENLLEQGSTAMAEQAFFRINETIMLRRSFRALKDVAALLQAHPEIERLRVEGHTDSQGSREFNVRLSQARAEAVVRFLVESGVAEERLEAIGLGPDRPAVANAQTPTEHARNRRVEFRVVELPRTP